VVSNAYLKPNEAFVTVPLSLMALGGNPGTMVLIMNSPTGQIVHYSMRMFGTTYGGRLFAGRRVPEPFKIIVLNPLKDLTCIDMFAEPENVICQDSAETRRWVCIQWRQGGRYPDATISSGARGSEGQPSGWHQPGQSRPSKIDVGY
jgi:hypothetical protein